MDLFFCPRRDCVAGHDKVKTVWFNYRAGLFECLDYRCNGKFTKTEMATCNDKLRGRYPKIQCPVCGSSNIVYAGYGGENPRFRCEESGHIFT